MKEEARMNPFPTMNRAPHAFLRNAIVVFVIVLGLMILLPRFVKGAWGIPEVDANRHQAILDDAKEGAKKP